jgi:hypothetical protein
MPNQPKKVVKYVIQHIVKAKTRLVLHHPSGQPSIIEDLSVNEASMIIDMLRNEQPVYYNPQNRLINTTEEWTGEGEI